MAEIFNAYAEGKTIEVFLDGDWCEITSNGFNFDVENDYYRIKKEPTYRPFKNGKECLEEMKKHEPYGYIKENGYAELYHITPGGGNFLVISLLTQFTYEQGFYHFTFDDGQPFGIKK